MNAQVEMKQGDKVQCIKEDSFRGQTVKVGEVFTLVSLQDTRICVETSSGRRPIYWRDRFVVVGS